ncbi:Reverse transcriptase, partial [Phytophthora palmivora]
MISGGYDGMAYFVDAETGQTQELRRPDAGIASANIERITTVCLHPLELNVVLLGTDKGCIYSHAWVLRFSRTRVTQCMKSFGQMWCRSTHHPNSRRIGEYGTRLTSCLAQSTVSRGSGRSATLLYDRLDDSMLAHTCLRAHPSRPYFVAQCSVLVDTTIPRKDVLLNNMSGCTLYSALDLVDRYYQILMRESNIPLTAVNTPSGMRWEWLVIPQGLSNAPA